MDVAMFGRCKPPLRGFLGVLAFLVPLGLLQVWVQHDRTSTFALESYTACVVAYDLPWSYRLWRLNPAADE